MTDQPPELRPHFQFDIRTLLALTALVAWLLAWAGGVGLMWIIPFTGLAMMEAACYRRLGVLQLLVRNLFVFFFCSLIVGAFAYGIACGTNPTGWYGTDHFWFFPFVEAPVQPSDSSAFAPSDFDYHSGTLRCLPFVFALFIVIVHRVLDGRARWPAYLLLWLVLAGCLFPLFVAWVGDAFFPGRQGWLGKIGFQGSYSPIALTALWTLLAGILVFGRKGDGARNRLSLFAPTCSRWLAAVGAGVVLLNSGPGMTAAWLIDGGSDSWSLSLVAQVLAPAPAGVIGATIVSFAVLRRFDLTLVLCGGGGAWIAFLCANYGIAMEASFSILVALGLVGIVAGALVVLSSWIFKLLQVDDPGAALATFGVPAVWGTLAVPLYMLYMALGFPYFGADPGFFKCLKWQCMGLAVSFLWAFPICLGVFLLIRHVPGLRLEKEGIENCKM